MKYLPKFILRLYLSYKEDYERENKRKQDADAILEKVKRDLEKYPPETWKKSEILKFQNTWIKYVHDELDYSIQCSEFYYGQAFLDKFDRILNEDDKKRLHNIFIVPRCAYLKRKIEEKQQEELRKFLS